MQPEIVIDKKLMREALRVSGLQTEQQAIELGLRTIIRLHHQEQLRLHKGKLNWEGDLDAMRSDS
jgi:Arc/MetJ family transcription regulator